MHVCVHTCEPTYSTNPAAHISTLVYLAVSIFSQIIIIIRVDIHVVEPGSWESSHHFDITSKT